MDKTWEEDMLPLCSQIFRRSIAKAEELTEAEAIKAHDFLSKKAKVAA
jgi:recombination protein RecT